MSCNDIWTIFTNFTIIKSVQIAITKSREAADHGPTLPYAQGATSRASQTERVTWGWALVTTIGQLPSGYLT